MVSMMLLAAASAETPVQHLLETKMFARIKALDDNLGGVLGVASIDLTSGRLFVYNGEAVFPTASSIKIPILVQMFKTVRNLDERVTLQPADAVAGSGQLREQLQRGPVTLTIRQLITAMIEHSDNTATNRCIAIAGMDRINRLLDSLGLRATRLRRIMMDGPAAERGEENTSSPIEMARLVEMLYRGKLGDARATTDMIGMMKLVNADMRKAIPAGIEVASKPGEIDGVRCEAGVVYLQLRPFILSVFSTYLDKDANPVPAVTRIAFEYFSKLASSNQYGHKVK